MFIVPATRYVQESRQLSRLLDNTLDQFFGAATRAEPAPRAPALDVAETDSAYTVTLDVPGVTKEDVKVAIDGRRVTVRTQTQADKQAVKQVETTGDAQADGQAAPAGGNGVANTADSGRIVYRERGVASYARSFTLPVEVEQAEAVAKLENGVLTLTLPKLHARGAAHVTVN